MIHSVPPQTETLRTWRQHKNLKTIRCMRLQNNGARSCLVHPLCSPITECASIFLVQSDNVEIASISCGIYHMIVVAVLLMSFVVCVGCCVQRKFAKKKASEERNAPIPQSFGSRHAFVRQELWELSMVPYQSARPPMMSQQSCGPAVMSQQSRGLPILSYG